MRSLLHSLTVARSEERRIVTSLTVAGVRSLLQNCVSELLYIEHAEVVGLFRI